MIVQEIVTINKEGQQVVTAAPSLLKNAQITLASLKTMDDKELAKGLLDLQKDSKQFSPELESKLAARGTSLLAILQVMKEGNPPLKSQEVKKRGN